MCLSWDNLNPKPWLKPTPLHTINDLIHVYSPEARAENPLGTNFWCQQKARITLTVNFCFPPGQRQTTLCGQNPDVNRKALSFCPFVASFKKISLKSDFIHNFSCFYTCIYSPGAGAGNPLGSEFLYKHMSLIICCKFLPLYGFLTVFPI